MPKLFEEKNEQSITTAQITKICREYMLKKHEDTPSQKTKSIKLSTADGENRVAPPNTPNHDSAKTPEQKVPTLSI